jgi:hypothetical protein
MSVTRHFILFVYAVLTAVLALLVPLSMAVLGNILLSLFNCADKGSYLRCTTPWLSDFANLLSTSMIITSTLLVLILYIAGFAALLLLTSLLFRLGILLVTHVIFRVGQ